MVAMESDPNQHVIDMPPRNSRISLKRFAWVLPIALTIAVIYGADVGVRRLAAPSEPRPNIVERIVPIDQDCITLQTSTFSRRLELIRTETPPTVECPRNQEFGAPIRLPNGVVFDNSHNYVPISLRFGPYEFNVASRGLVYKMYSDLDVIQLWLQKPCGLFQRNREPIEGAAFDIDGEIYRPKAESPAGELYYLVPRFVLGRIGSAKSVTIIASDPKWNYTLTAENLRGVGDLAEMIEKIRLLK